MIDLDFYAALPYGAVYLESRVHPGVRSWMPKYCMIAYPTSLEHINQLTEADWLSVGAFQDSMTVLFSQLGQLRLLGTPEQNEALIPRADYNLAPVLLAFTLAQAQQGRLEVSRTVPPANLGEVGIIASTEDDKTIWTRCPINKLSNESQQLQQRMGAALSALASARLERSAWLEQWREIQAMARKLAADYWHAYQDSQVEHPQPINIWKLAEQEGAIAAMTMVQDGAHASINNKDKWEREHMIDQGQHQGLIVGRYIHEHTSGVAEYWMQHPEEVEAPIDPDLVSQEVLRQQAKLNDLDADLVTLAPVYLLAKGGDEVYISPEQLLGDLDFTPHRNQAGYGNSYEPDEMRRVIDAFERLAWLQIKTRQHISRARGRKPALITAEAPYLIITERIWQEPLDESGPRRFLGWKYQITWLKNFTGSTEAGKQLGVLLKKSFGFKQNHQRWEKRLARYLTIHLCVAAHKGQARVNCINRRVLEHCGLMPSERDKARPAEYTQQFKRAMGNLKTAGIIGDWKSTLDENTLPPRAWLDLWLDSSFWVTQSPTALAAGYQKMIDTRKRPDGQVAPSAVESRAQRGRKSRPAR